MTVLLLAGCDSDNSGSAAALVTPPSQLPLAFAGHDVMVDEGSVVTLAGSGEDPDGGAVSFTWEQTSGPAAVGLAPAGATLNFTAPAVETDSVMTFALRVLDDETESATDTVTVTVRDLGVANLPPVAAAGADRNADAFDRVAMDGSNSSDPESGALSHAWTQTAGPAVALGGANTALPSFEAPDVAAVTPLIFRLTVTDSSGLTNADDITVTVLPLPDLTGLVDPRIGSVAPGFTNPGPVVPFGMVNLGPDTEGPLNYGGYYVQNALITGFSHVHMSAGVFKGGYFPVLPFTGPRTPGDLSQLGYPQPVPAYASAFEHATEVAEAGYYAVRLLRYGVLAELTASERVGLHRYTFENPAQPPRLLLDLSRNLNGFGAATVRLAADGTLSGQSDSDDGFPVFFAAQLSAPFTAKEFDGAPLAPDATLSGNALGLDLDFPALDGPLLLKLAVSYTDEAGAIANLAEVQDFDFDATRAAAHAKWKRALARIRVTGGTPAEQISFYSALYRLHHFPNLHSDVDGRYRGPDGALHVSAERPHYSQFSSWDSYRGQNAMQAELFPDIYREMILSLLDFKTQAGFLPRWQQGPKDASHMSGDPIIPFIGEAWCRGQLDAPLRTRAWPALLDMPAARSPELATLGFLSVPVPDNEVAVLEGGSGRAGTTLEYGIADFSLALMAQDAAPALAAGIAQRSLNYRNLLDTEDSKWIRPRHADGSWLEFFHPELGYGFQEGTSWQYSWLAMHDFAGLIEGMDGDAPVIQRLDQFFGFPAGALPIALASLQNAITAFGTTYYGNQYAPGNEHDLEAPYVYSYAGAPWKTQAVARAAASIYTPTPNGLPGNDDLGALSGWLLWTMAGLYPINPGTPLYVVGSPHFDKVTLKRQGNNRGDLTIEAAGASLVNRFVTGLSVNGAASERSWLVLPQSAATVTLTTSALPDRDWAAAPALRPPSFSADALEVFGCEPSD